MTGKTPTILVIGPTPPPYHGVSIAIQTILDSAIADRFRLIHLDITDRRGITHVDKPDFYDVFLFIAQWFRNIWLLMRKHPALVYIPISQTKIGFLRDSLFLIPAFIARCGVIVHLHGANFDILHGQAGWLWQVYMGAILHRVSRFIVLGEMLKPLFLSWAHLAQISVVPNGIPESLGDTGSDILLEYDERRLFRVVFLSTLSRQKGLFVLLNSIPLIIEKHPAVEFLIAGPWWGKHTQAEAEKFVVAIGLADRVRFVGELVGKEKMVFLHSGDVFVFPGIQQEGQPLTVLEAMCAALPVVATDRGCLRETIVDGVTGFIIPPNSPKAIAEKVIYLIGRPDLRQKMARSSRERYEQEYTLEKFAARMERLFTETLPPEYDRHTSAHSYSRSKVS